MKKVIKKILFPNDIIGFLSFNLGFGLLIYVFYNHLENTWVSYVSYLLSFYALILFCLWFYKVCKRSNQTIKRSKMYHFYQKNTRVITTTSQYVLVFFNFLYGIMKLILGSIYKSWWFITFAIYYLLLSFMRITLVKEGKNPSNKCQKLKHTGIILLCLNVILTGIVILIIKQDRIIYYHGFLIYLVALYDFYLIIYAIIKVFKYRKNHNPIIIASKCLNLTVAMISIISLEIAMIYQFGNNDSNFKFLMTSLTGFGVCIINSIMAIYMILKAKNLKKAKNF